MFAHTSQLLLLGTEWDACMINAGAERDVDTEAEAKQKGDMLFTDDRLSGYRSIVHKTYFVLEYVVSR